MASKEIPSYVPQLRSMCTRVGVGPGVIILIVSVQNIKFPACTGQTLNEFPVLTTGKYTGGDPKADRVIYTNTSQFCGEPTFLQQGCQTHLLFLCRLHHAHRRPYYQWIRGLFLHSLNQTRLYRSSRVQLPCYGSSAKCTLGSFLCPEIHMWID